MKFIEIFPNFAKIFIEGWGRIGGGMPISPVLQKVDLQFYSKYDCAQLHEPGWVLNNNVCAGKTGA